MWTIFSNNLFLEQTLKTAAGFLHQAGWSWGLTTVSWRDVQLFILIVMRWQCYHENFAEAPSPSLCHLDQDLRLYLAVKAVAVAAAYSGRNLELDSSRLNLCQEDILWTKANLFTLGMVSGEMLRMCPLVQVPVPKSAEAIVMPCVPAGRWRNELPGFQYLFGKPESGIPCFCYCFPNTELLSPWCTGFSKAL